MSPITRRKSFFLACACLLELTSITVFHVSVCPQQYFLMMNFWPGTFSIYKDDVLLVEDQDYIMNYNGTHYMFDISYNHSVHTMRIVSSEVIPDLPSNLLMMMLIIMILSAGALVFGKKILKNQN